ncbi:MAG: hydroxymethylbilane synthase [Pseudomonadota bacterium]|nr:hydroxymethylbilane synthase [Pseudomonadota bacterium]
MSSEHKLRVGTRGSPLALAQTAAVIDELKKTQVRLRETGAVEMVVIKTTGDRVQNKLLLEIGGKGMFTKEIDEAMLNHQIDIGVHSMKDMPTLLPEGINLHSILAREDPREAFISNICDSFEDLPINSKFGTASLRRKSQVLHIRNDLQVTPLRGNIETRLTKITNGEVDATMLAVAGLKRLGKQNLATEIIEKDVILPAVGQGSIAATCRENDPDSNSFLSTLSQPVVAAAAAAERAMLTILDGSCHTPIAGYAAPDGRGNLELWGLIADPEGEKTAESSKTAPITDAQSLGKLVAEDLLVKAGPNIINSIRKDIPIFIPVNPEMKRNKK